MGDDERPPPDGFTPSRSRGPFTQYNGPIYDRLDGDRLERGFHVLGRHCNSFGLVHGGMLSTFLDGLLAAQCHRTVGRVGVTIQLSTDFLSMAREGDWIAGDARVTRHATDLVFVEGRAHVGGRDIARAHAIFKLLSRKRAD